MAFRRRVLFEVGGFDEAFRFGGEDEDLCRRVHSRPGGGRLRYAPGAVIVHWFEQELSDTLRRSRAYGRGNARTSLKHPDARPIVFPVPVAAAALLLAGLARRPGRRPGRLVLSSVLLPLLAYPRWLSLAARSGSLEPASYPYLQLAQEVCVMIGEAQGLRAGYRPIPADHLHAAGTEPASYELSR
jgi:cellulose synthase/poly-beta-1,6-N-acetylglucosamine synthase-like glycosyltransferase